MAQGNGKAATTAPRASKGLAIAPSMMVVGSSTAERRNVGFVWRECALDQNSAKMTIHRYTITYDHGECHGEGMDHDGNVEYKGQITLS